MLTGTLCPQCGKPVMPYRRFLREAEPRRVSLCSNCGVALKRKHSVWWLLAVSAVIVAVIIGYGVPLAANKAGVVGAVMFLIVVGGGSIFVINICGWLFVGWTQVAPQTSVRDNNHNAL